MLRIYTDGSSSRHSLAGGWAYAVTEENRVVHLGSAGALQTTNNRMEITAALEGLRYLLTSPLLRPGEAVEVVSDSQYVVNFTEAQWRYAWQITDWKNANGDDVKNRDLWEALDQTLSRFEARRIQVAFRWVRGHNGNRFNEECDKLAGEARCRIEAAHGLTYQAVPKVPGGGAKRTANVPAVPVPGRERPRLSAGALF